MKVNKTTTIGENLTFKKDRPPLRGLVKQWRGFMCGRWRQSTLPVVLMTTCPLYLLVRGWISSPDSGDSPGSLSSRSVMSSLPLH